LHGDADDTTVKMVTHTSDHSMTVNATIEIPPHGVANGHVPSSGESSDDEPEPEMAVGVKDLSAAGDSSPPVIDDSEPKVLTTLTTEADQNQNDKIDTETVTAIEDTPAVSAPTIATGSGQGVELGQGDTGDDDSSKKDGDSDALSAHIAPAAMSDTTEVDAPQASASNGDIPAGSGSPPASPPGSPPGSPKPSNTMTNVKKKKSFWSRLSIIFKPWKWGRRKKSKKMQEQVNGECDSSAFQLSGLQPELLVCSFNPRCNLNG